MKKMGKNSVILIFHEYYGEERRRNETLHNK